MEKILKNKRIIIFAIGIILIVILSVFIYNYNNNDGMENINDASVSYRVYTQDKWSKWSKNGITSGNNNNPIKNLELKIKAKGNVDFSFSVYNLEKGWIDDIDLENGEINAIKIDLYRTLSKKYSICYRTYNKEDKWLNWSCDYEINGNKNQNITAIEIKLIPKYGIKNEYLKDYIDDNNRKELNFE